MLKRCKAFKWNLSNSGLGTYRYLSIIKTKKESAFDNDIPEHIY